MDATHVGSGRVVVIKRFEKGSSEKEIALLMNSDGMTDEKKHSVPILDTFEGMDRVSCHALSPPLI